VLVEVDTKCPAIEGKRGDALFVTLTREVAAKAAGITAIIDNKLTVLKMFFIPFLHIYFVFILSQISNKKKGKMKKI
jgi:hypothetical protein